MNKVYENRPWGDFIRYTNNEPSTVKIITVLPNQSLSLQYHHDRQEFWKVLKGNPVLIIGEKEIEAKEGEEFFIEKEMRHRISSRDEKVEILEISIGNFSEEDIVRIDDVYGRK